jgi:hypothetical protein
MYTMSSYNSTSMCSGSDCCLGSDCNLNSTTIGDCTGSDCPSHSLGLLADAKVTPAPTRKPSAAKKVSEAKKVDGEGKSGKPKPAAQSNGAKTVSEKAKGVKSNVDSKDKKVTKIAPK